MEWLRVHPEYLKLPEAEADVQIWESFWDTLAKAVNHYNAHKTNTSSLPIPSYLPEEAELRGFRPLFLAFRSLPPFVFVQPIPIDDQPVTPVSMGSPSLLMYRVQKICEFAVLASRQVITHNFCCVHTWVRAWVRAWVRVIVLTSFQ